MIVIVPVPEAPSAKIPKNACPSASVLTVIERPRVPVTVALLAVRVCPTVKLLFIVIIILLMNVIFY